MTHRYYTSPDQSNFYPMLFSMPDYNPFDETAADMYSYTSSSSSSTSSSVDCTLSLGTPSTRLTYDTENRNHHDRRSGSSCMSSNYWDMVPSPPTPTHHRKPSRGTNSSNSSGDPLLARRCANCDTTSTPLWRNGPRGPKSLCNACGIRFKKEERRASAAAASAAGAGAAMEHQQMLNNSWVQYSQPQIMQCYSPAMGNEFGFIDGDVSWRLNVADRPSLVHDFSL